MRHKSILLCGLFALAGPARAETPSGNASSEICSAVTGLCASKHVASLPELRKSLSSAQRQQLDASRAFLDRAQATWAQIFDPALRNAAGGAGGVIGRQTQPGSGTDPRIAGQGPVDPGIFGPRGGGAGEALPGSGVIPRRNSVGGSAGAASNAVRGSGGLPGRGSTVAMGGDLPGHNAQPDKGGNLVDGSSPNEHGGVTRVTSNEGHTKIVETRSVENGSWITVTTIAPDGSSDVDIDYAGPLSRPGQQDRIIYHAHRDGPIGWYNYTQSTSRNDGATWQTQTRGRDVNPIPRELIPNVDPDSVGGRSSYPPACAIANPDCGMPLLLRFRRDNPGVRGRPDDTVGSTPRLRTDRFGNVVNPGLEPVAGGSGGTPGTSARAIDGGKLTNPADQRSGTGTGTGTGSGGPPKP